MRRLSALFGGIAILLAPMVGQGQAALAEPVALILELDGDTEPAVEAFGELAAGDTVRLSDEGTMLFLHYPSCAEVTVKGGRLVMSAERYTLQGGRIVGVDRARCPKTVVLSQSGATGGVVIRSGGGKDPKLGSRPEFVLAGLKTDNVAKVRIRRGDQRIADVALQSNNFMWPKSQADLPDGKGYVAELLDSAGTVIQTLDFEVTSRGRPAVTVVRVK